APMILQALLLFSLLRVCHADSFPECPSDTACLYHATCIPQTNNSVLGTVDKNEADDFAKINCSESQGVSRVTLSIQPLSKTMWNLKLAYHVKKDEIRLGESLIIIADHINATFNPSPNLTSEIEVIDTGNAVQFTLKSPKSLLDIFRDLDVTLRHSDATISSTKQPDFWQKVHELTPCDASLIIDHCKSNLTDCSTLAISEQSITCTTGLTLW
ncbi:hypothetical protein PMAYCL1PPCAC_27726, partial [Pristionchus mayeri]